MGAFYLSNELNEMTLPGVLKIFQKKNLNKFHELKAKSFTLLYFEKAMIKTDYHVYQKGEDWIVGLGCFFYKNEFIEKALPLLLEDLVEENEICANEIFGHFNLILFKQGKLKIITDKTGTYHSYQTNISKTNKMIFSNSLIAIKESLESVTPSKQECLEFIASDSSYGGKTICKEIDFITFGSTLEISLNSKNKLTYRKYFKEKILKSTDHIKFIIENNTKLINQLKKVPIPITADLSGGLDTRLVCAHLNSIQIPYKINTTTNQFYAEEAKLVLSMAKKLKLELDVIDTDVGFNHKNFDTYFEENYWGNELCRDLFYAISTTNFYKQTSHIGSFFLGGYGGENYRDIKYRSKKIKNFGELYTYKKHLSGVYGYNSLKVILSESEYQEYLSNLESKFFNNGLLETRSINSEITKIEKDYYINRMMYWGGSEITRFNQYCYRLHPLLDYNSIYPLFDTPDSLKKNFKLQMQIIEKLDPYLASLPSDYGYNFIWKGDSWVSLIKKYRDLKKMFSRMRKKYQHSTTDQNNFFNLVENKLQFFTKSQKQHISFINLDPGLNIDTRTKGNVQSLNYFFKS